MGKIGWYENFDDCCDSRVAGNMGVDGLRSDNDTRSSTRVACDKLER